MEIIQVLSFFALVLIVIIGALLLFTLWKSARIMGGINQQMNDAQTQFKEAVRIMGEMNQRMDDTETQFGKLREEVKDFTQDLSPFFAGGRELIEDILKNKRAAEEAQVQGQSE
jgi:uncharacterized membrane-anchored protein YhcB (DUF1043 family)|tara:strand:- start:284 stop:625 length:342 start_codon:yes stop_codon:yes gene_type:complete